jgi:hypothetical protein
VRFRLGPVELEFALEVKKDVKAQGGVKFRVISLGGGPGEGEQHVLIVVWKHGVSIYGWDQGRDARLTPTTPSSRRPGDRYGCRRRTPPKSPATSSAT